MEEQVNYYTELELDRNLSAEELEKQLKAAFKKWRRKTNTPDPDKRYEVEKMMKLIVEARSILTDPAKKEAYDKTLAEQNPHQVEAHSSSAREGHVEYEPLYAEAQRLIELRSLDEVLTITKQLIDSNPNDWRGWEMAGRAHYFSENFEVARNHYQKALELEKNTDFIYNNLGFALMDLEDFVEAFRSFQRALEINPGHDISLTQCDNLLSYMNIDSVLPFFENLKEKRNDSLAFETLAKAYSLKAERAVPVQNGMPSFTNKEQTLDYLSFMKRAKSLSDKPEYSQKVSQAEKALGTEYDRLYEKASNFIKVKDTTEAKACANQLVDINPTDWRGWELIGRSYFFEGDKELAQNYYKKALELKETPFVYKNLGIAQENLGMRVEAFRNFQRSLELDPKWDLTLKYCYDLLHHMNIDSVLPFFENLKEKRNDALIYETLARAYVLKADRSVREKDGVLYFTSQEQIEEYIELMEKAKSYNENLDLDQKIAVAEHALKKDLDKSKAPVLICAVLNTLFPFLAEELTTPFILYGVLAVALLILLTYWSIRPRYETNRWEIEGEGTLYDKVIDKTYLNGSVGCSIGIWIILSFLLFRVVTTYVLN